MASLILPQLALAVTGATAATLSTATAATQAAVAAAAVIGSYIDSTFLLPRLLRDKDSDQVKNLQITGLDEGDPHAYAIGRYNRMGSFLYYQPKVPRFVKGREGGKGGGSSKRGTPDKYYSDGVFVLTRTGIDTNVEPFDRYPITPLLSRIWLDGKLRYYSDDAARSESALWEIYESVENDGGFVSLNYTIQGKYAPGSPELSSQNITDYGFENRFRPGQRIRFEGTAEVANVGNPDYNTTAALLGDNRRLSDGDPTARDLKIVSAGTLFDGRPYLQVEWQYYFDSSIYEDRNGERHNGPFYGTGPGIQSSTPGFGTFPSARVPFGAFQRGEWSPPLGTVPSTQNGGLQDRGYLEFAGGAEGNNVIVSQVFRPFSSGLASSFRILTGEVGSNIAVIEREEGVAPSLTSFGSLVIENLDLTDFGNRLPNVEVEVAADASAIWIGEAIRRILTVYHDLDPDKLDVSQLPNTLLVNGYWWTAPFGPQVLQPLIIAYDLSVIESDGKLTFRRRVDNPEYTIPLEDLGVGVQGSNSENKYFSVSEASRSEDVIETTVVYSDLAGGLARGEQIFRRPDLQVGKSQNFDFQRLTLSADQAREIAQRTTWQATMFKQEVSFVVGPKWGFLLPGDVVNYTAYGTAWRVVLTETTRGEDNTLSCVGYRDTGLADDMPTLDTDLGGSPIGINSTYIPPDTKVVAMNIGPLTAEDALTPGLYLAGCAKLFGADFRGGAFYQALGTPDQQGSAPSYEFIDNEFGEDLIGTLITQMPDGSADLINDSGAKFQVRLMEGEAEGAPDLPTVYEREYLMYVNGEVMAYENVSLVPDPEFGGPLYEVSGELLRGVYNTEHLIAPHPAGSTVVFIRRPELRRVEVPVDAIDLTEIRYTFPPTQGDVGTWQREEYGVDVVNPRTASGAFASGSGFNAGANGRPFSPSHLRAAPEVSVDNLPLWEFSSTNYEVDDRVVVIDTNGDKTAYKCLIQHNPAAESNAGNGDRFPPNTPTYWEEVTPTPRDFRIRWNFRTPVPIAALPATTAETLRGLTTFTLRIYDQAEGTLLRTVADLDVTEYLYTDQQQFDDGLVDGVFYAEVRAATEYMTSEWATAELPNNG